ncbi:hypothetical protein EW026_g8378 [Hermanssonia centrifuga]|uniref:Uncharacterized protein n=1 Tax=Hermanssonia centrifuga TaxID=98765 RepID=A0A4V3X936_9APHY|nr:hypothetical protein EW026_g8378 [Hermanssonia centrifuga]
MATTSLELKIVDPNSIRRPLDEKCYNLDNAEEEFIMRQTGIQDPQEVKKHVIAVQAEAYEIFPYPCIFMFGFAKLKISRFPAYKELLRLGKERQGALFLDMACCVGNDVRKAVADGFPVNQALASDLEPGFWKVGHNLFKSTPETFPVPFIPGDAFDSAFLAPATISTSLPDGPVPPLSSLTSLTPLIGRLSVIHASSFFHLFNEELQLQLAKRMGSLLSPEPGSFIFGGHGGFLQKKGPRSMPMSAAVQSITMFCHSPESWKELWEKEIFSQGKVKVEVYLKEVQRQDLPAEENATYHLMICLNIAVTDSAVAYQIQL